MDQPLPYVNSEPVRLGIMIPCYNEEKNVANTLHNVATALAGFDLTCHVLVIDDHSTDRTVSCVKEFARGKQLPITCLSNHENEGLGYNYFLGACLINSEYYMMINGDNVEPVGDIRAIVARIGAADMIIPHWKNLRRRGWFRYSISTAYTGIVNRLSGNRIRYYNAPVLHRRANVLRFYAHHRTRGFGYQTEIVCYLVLDGAACEHVAIEGDICSNKNTSAFRLKNILSVAMTLLAITKRRIFHRWKFELETSRFTIHDLS